MTTTATLIASPEAAPPKIADAVLAEALAEPQPQAPKRKPNLAELHAAFLATDREYQPLAKLRDEAWETRNEIEKRCDPAMEAAKADVPLPAALQVPNLNPSITSGFIQFADGTLKDLTPSEYKHLRSHGDIDDYVARNPSVDPEPLRSALHAFHFAQLKALEAAGPEFVRAHADFERAAFNARVLGHKRGRLFDAIMRQKASTLDEVYLQAEVVARFGDGEVKRQGGVRIPRQLYEHDAARLLERVTDLIAMERRGTPVGELSARMTRVLARYKAIEVVEDAAREARQPENRPKIDKAIAELTEVEERLAHTPARTLGDLILKARLGERHFAGEPDDARFPTYEDDFGTTVARALVRDLLALAPSTAASDQGELH